MIRSKLLLVLTSLITITPITQAAKNKICFTLDDLPVDLTIDSSYLFQKTVTKQLIATFTKYKIPAIGFVNEDGLYQKNNILSDEDVELLRDWLNAGLELGNHTSSHLNYNRVSFNKFTANIKLGEIITRPLMAQYHKKLTYFRHPFLSMGGSQAKADSLSEFLTKHNYIVAPITLGNNDWIFNDAYDVAILNNDKELMHRIGKCYIEYTKQQIKFSEYLSNKICDRQINQIMLLHANSINRDYLDDVAQLFVDANYQFVSLKKAMKDKMYKTPLKIEKKMDSSWLLRWAVAKNMKHNFYADVPLIPAFILKLAKLPLDYK